MVFWLQRPSDPRFCNLRHLRELRATLDADAARRFSKRVRVVAFRWGPQKGKMCRIMELSEA